MSKKLQNELLDVSFRGWDNSRLVSIVRKGKLTERGIFISIVREECRCRTCYNRLHKITEYAIRFDSDYCWVTNTDSAMEKAGLPLKETQIAVKIPLAPKGTNWRNHMERLLGVEWERETIVKII